MFNNQTINLDEILAEMDKNLTKNAAKEAINTDIKKLEALAYLNNAVDVFETLGMTNEAEAITRIAEMDDSFEIDFDEEEEEPHSWKPEIETKKEKEFYDEALEDEEISEGIALNVKEEDEMFEFDNDLSKLWD